MARKFHHRHVPQLARKTRSGSRTKPMALVLGLLVVLFGAGYLVQINIASSKGYQIRSLENQISELKEQSERLELKVAQEQSVQAVENKVQSMGMVPTPNVEYIAVTAPTVAQR
ncbi:MAG: hypothetical protein WC866_01055 [Patescibacteria group bacterium]|jgi:hypothetical protein